MTELTRALLDAATELLAAHGSRGLRMADVAYKAGVSRQTAYNEFGNKQRLVEAVALDKTREFLDGAQEALDAHPDPVDGLREAMTFIFAFAGKDPLACSLLGGANAEDMLPLVTTKGHPVLTAATDVFCAHIRAHYPLVAEPRARMISETIVRVAISHLLTPSHDAVDAVVEVAGALLNSGTMDP